MGSTAHKPRRGRAKTLNQILVTPGNASEQAAKYAGRLELTWTNKQLCLLAQEDGAYEWLLPSDFRIAEVRLLHSAAGYGSIEPDRSRAKDNLVIRGDALQALTSLTKLPEFASEYVGKVRLVYLDPPFNTQQAFQQYDDALEHSVWLTMIRDRLMKIKELLAPDGSLWVHCDDAEQHRLRCVLDEVFGADRFVATVLWQKRYSRDNRPAIGPVHDFIHVYAPNPEKWKRARNLIPRDAKAAKQYRNPNNDERGPWRSIPLNAQGYRKNQMYPITSPAGVTFMPPKGRCWSTVESGYKELLAAGRIYFGKDGKAAPGVIRYLSETDGLVPWTWWPSEEVGHNDEAKKEILSLFPNHPAFATPKPERLMHRIIAIASNPGDIVLDCFSGSATTAAVAHKMGRRWVVGEWSRETVETYAIPRLTQVIAGSDDGGVTEDVGWTGGGGFRVLDIAPSMFAADDGVLVLSDWATNSKLAEATAAQLGFSFELDPPFCGAKGRTRLAVIDGLVNAGVVELLIKVLPDGQRLLVCGTALDPEAREMLRAKNLGNARKIPASIINEYADERRWSVPGPADTSPSPAEPVKEALRR